MAQNVEYGIEDELEKLDPVPFIDPLINTIYTGRDKMTLVGLCTALKSTRDVVRSAQNPNSQDEYQHLLLEGKWFLIDVTWVYLVTVQIGALCFLYRELLVLSKLLGTLSIRSQTMIIVVVEAWVRILLQVREAIVLCNRHRLVLRLLIIVHIEF